MTELYDFGLNENQNSNAQSQNKFRSCLYKVILSNAADRLLQSAKKLLICHGLQGQGQNQTKQTGNSLSDERKASSLGGLFSLSLRTVSYLHLFHWH